MLTNGEQRPMGVKFHNEKGTTAIPIYFSFASRYQESYSEEMEHFLNVVQGKLSLLKSPLMNHIFYSVLWVCLKINFHFILTNRSQDMNVYILNFT